jgi:hypothetical protein
MTTLVIHSALIYRHHHLADERVNVGVLAIFPDSGNVVLLAPSKKELTRRVTATFQDAPTTLIWQYLRSFEARAKNLSGHLQSYLGNYEDVITDHFLTENGASLYFDAWKTSPIWKDELTTKTWLYGQWLSGYGRSQTDIEGYVTDRHVASLVRDLIKEAFAKKKKPTDYQLYFKEEQRTLNSGVVQFTSSGYWKNGAENLVHPLSLDVKTVDGIVAKSLVVAKTAELLCQKAAQENVNFHLLLAKPHKEELLDAYEESVRVLENTKAPLSVIRPEEQADYVKNVVRKAVVL